MSQAWSALWYFPNWATAIFIAFWYLYFGRQVIEGPLTLGFFLTDLKVSLYPVGGDAQWQGSE